MSPCILVLLITGLTHVTSETTVELNSGAKRVNAEPNCTFYETHTFYVVCKVYYDELGAEVDEIIEVELLLVSLRQTYNIYPSILFAEQQNGKRPSMFALSERPISKQHIEFEQIQRQANYS